MIESAGTYAAMSTLSGRAHQSHAKAASASRQMTTSVMRNKRMEAHPNVRREREARHGATLDADSRFVSRNVRSVRELAGDNRERRRLRPKICPPSWPRAFLETGREQSWKAGYIAKNK